MIKKAIAIVAVALIATASISCITKGAETEVSTTEPTMEIIDRRDYWREHPEECPFEALTKANALAKVADAVCPDNASSECLAAVMACVWNRANANGFPNTLEAVANQPYQWEGLTADFQPNDNVKRLAKEMLAEWESEDVHVLPIPRNCVFMRLDTDGIWFRSQWDGDDECFIAYN